MGEVYRAEDTKLDREVALKVLPEAFIADEERLARFEREAKVLASLNHPNIAGIYEVDDAEGVHFLAMELAEGVDLADRMATGPIPLADALPIALQIAEGLEAAHQSGIVHRDLKPANVKITPTGQVKILDFGLAKAWEGPGKASPDLTASPTLTAQMTQAGVILGTAAYMSPEQARGEEADQRADIWAFGVILYEMLIGEQLFREPTVSDTLAAVLRADLDLERLPADTPWRVRDVLGRCLERDPRQRMHSIADARIELTAPEADAPPIRAAEEAPPSRLRTWLPWALVAVLGALLAAPLVGPDPPATEDRVVQFDVVLGSGDYLDTNGSVAAISPDGSRLVIQVDQGTQRNLYLRRLDDPDIERIPGTEGAGDAFFSPDGRWIAFGANGWLRKISLETHAVVDIVEATWGNGAWGPDDQIIYAPSYLQGLWRVSANGGEPEMLTEPDPERKELGHFWPQFLPGDRHVLFTNFKPPLEETRLEILDLDDGSRTILLENAAHGLYMGGHLVFARNSTLFAARFDPERREIVGSAVPILSDIAVNEGQGNAFLSASSDGSLVYVQNSVFYPESHLVWVDRLGREELITDEKRQFGDPSVSPDGRKIAMSIRTDEQDVWVLDLERGSFARLTDFPTSEFNPFWTPDGERLVFNYDAPPYDIWVMNADGSGSPAPLFESSVDKQLSSISRQGLVAYDDDLEVGYALQVIDLAAPEAGPKLIEPSKYNLDAASFSPDGRWMVFSSDESGQNEVFIRQLADGAPKHQVSIGGGSLPIWSRDGDEIFYRQSDRFVAVSIETEPELDIGRPEELFDYAYSTSTTGRVFDVAPDGRFVFVKNPEGRESNRVSVVLNFDELLARLVPHD